MLQRPTIQQVQQTVEVPQVQHFDRIVDLPAVCQHQESIITIAQKTVEFPQAQFIDRVVDVPVTAQRLKSSSSIKYVDAPVGVQADSEIELEIPTPVVEDTASAWTGVNQDITETMNPLLSISDGEGLTPPVADPSCRKREGSDIIQSPRVRAVTRAHDGDDRCEMFLGDTASTDEMEGDAYVHAVAPASSRALKGSLTTRSREWSA